MKKLLLIAFLSMVGSAPAFAAHTITLLWSQSTDPIALNCVARSATSGAEDFTKPIFCSTTPITTWTDTAVAVGDTWFYKVDAVDAKGNASKNNPETSATVSPLPVTNLQANSN